MVTRTNSVLVVVLICIITLINIFVNERKYQQKTSAFMYQKKIDSQIRTPRNKETVGTNDDKICVIHVGPHKTGTTALQRFLMGKKSQPTVDALTRDNYEVPVFPTQGSHSKNHAGLANCLRPDEFVSEGHCPDERFKNKTFKYFQSFVNNATKNGSNFILTAEAFDKPDVNTTELASYLGPEYKTHVVLYYRRFYDWIHSYYNQVIKGKKNKDFRTFVEWLTQETFDLYKPLYSVAVYNRYQKVPGVFNVSVVNMHKNPDNFDTAESFSCNHLDHAPHLCEVAKSQRVEQMNRSTDRVNWRVLKKRVQMHHSIRLLDKDKRWQQIQLKFNEMTDIPQVCLSGKWKNILLQISLESEIALTPEWWYNGKEGLENLRSDYEDKINSKLCSIDFNAILTSLEWQNFLTELEEDRIKEES